DRKRTGSQGYGNRSHGTREVETRSETDFPIGLELWGGGSRYQFATTEASHAGNDWNEGPRLQDPGARRVFRKKHRGRRSERHHPRIKNHSRNEVVRSRANQRPYRKWRCWPLPGHLARWIYTGGVIPEHNALHT